MEDNSRTSRKILDIDNYKKRVEKIQNVNYNKYYCMLSNLKIEEGCDVMKNLKRVILILMMIVLIISNVSLGFDISGIGDLDAYNGDGVSSGTFVDMINSVVHIIQVVGSIVSVAVLIILGIKYMIGSTDERAEYKRTLMPYFIGAVLFFGIVNIASIINEFAQSLVK